MTWWSRAARSTRIVSVALWAVGTMLSGVGLYGDIYHWWDGQPFATNLLSAAAGACFGVPVVLLFLQDLYGTQVEYARQYEARIVAVGLLRQAVLNVTDLIDAEDIYVSYQADDRRFTIAEDEEPTDFRRLSGASFVVERGLAVIDLVVNAADRLRASGMQDIQWLSDIEERVDPLRAWSREVRRSQSAKHIEFPRVAARELAERLLNDIERISDRGRRQAHGETATTGRRRPDEGHARHAR